MSIASTEIHLEDVGGRVWWKSALTTLFSQYGSAQMRFVAAADHGTEYRSPTFTVPRSVRNAVPQEQWAPDMNPALQALRADLEGDGWVEVSRGEQPWQLRYERHIVGHAA